MSESSRPIPSGHEHLIPHLVVSPCAEAIEFYKRAFGAEEVHRLTAPDGRRLSHAAIRIDGSCVFLADDFPEYCGGASRLPAALNGTPISLHRYVTDCDAAIQRAADAGATVMMPASDCFWGDRYGVIVDPYGHQWSFATRIKELSHDEMQAAMKEAFAAADQSVAENAVTENA